MRKIDADMLKKNVEYACESNGDKLSLEWLNWFITVIDRMPTIDEDKKSECGNYLYKK